MPIKLRTLVLSLVLAGIASSPVLAATHRDNSTDMLMRGAKQWLSKDRPDLARNMLKKLILIDPSSEEALFMLGNLELRSGKPDDALPYLRSLEQVAPNGARTRELGNSYRLATSDKAPLEKARSLAQAGKNAEAKKVLNQLYQGAPPKGEAAIEYYRIAGYSPEGYAQAQDSLAALYKETGDVRYRLVQLELQANRPEHLASAIRGYEELAASRAPLKSLRDGWKNGLYRLPDGESKPKAIKQFLAFYPDDKDMSELLADANKNIAGMAQFAKPQNIAIAAPPVRPEAVAANEQQEPAGIAAKKAHRNAKKKPPETAPAAEAPPPAENPDIAARSEALDALQDGKIAEAEAALTDLLKRRPNDAEVIGGLGLVKLKQGKPGEAADWFSRALRAAQAARGETSRWASLVGTANFWKLLGTAETLLKERKLAESEAAIRHALALKPDHPAALAVLGNIKVAAKDYPEAERVYRKGLQQEGYNTSIIVGLVDLLSRTQRGPEALELLEHTLAAYPAEWKKNPNGKVRLLREAAILNIAQHRPGLALKALEEGVQLDPKNPWTRFFLAKLYINLDLLPLAKRVIQEGVALDPQNAEMRYVQALVLLSVDDYGAGLDALNKIPAAELTEPMRNARDRALIQYAIRQAESRLAQGDRKEAIRIMSVAEAESQGNYQATEQVAEGWFKLGLPEQGLSAMRKLPHPMPLEAQVRYASLLNRAKKDQELVEYLPGLQIPDAADDTTLGYKATVRDIELSMAGRQFDKLRAEGKVEQAQQLADAVLGANHLSTPEYFRAHRTYFFKAALPEDAIASLTQEKIQAPDDAGIRWDLAYAYYQSKQNDNAQQELRELLAMTKADDVAARLRIAGLQQSTGDIPGAMQTIDDLTNRFPDNMDVLFQAGNLAQSRGKYNAAMGYYEQARELARKGFPASGTAPTLAQQEKPSGILLDLLPAKQTTAIAQRGGADAAPKLPSTPESSGIYRAALASDTVKGSPSTSNNVSARAEREMASIEARQTAKIEAGLDIQSKRATDGTSTYNATEVPVSVRFPIGYEAHGTVQVDKLNIDVGALPPTLADASIFGKVKAYNVVPAGSLTPQSSGTSVGVAYEQGSVKADIGKVGIGFPVSNVVGGIRTGGMMGQLSYSLNLSRRPYTGSQVSYAGARDPVTGDVWGGVTQTGVSLYMSTELRSFNAAAMASYGLLRGKNVLNNDRLFLRAVVDKDVYRFGGATLNVGLNANYMSFSKNESFYSFGHGGYYSPQSSLSVGLPIELSGREDLLAYALRVSATYSSTKEDFAAYYPTDPVLQAMTGGATYAGGNGGGFGYGMLAMAEYRIAPDYMLGARFSMDRSAYYAPNALLLYLRHWFKPEAGLDKRKPDPVVPYSQY